MRITSNVMVGDMMNNLHENMKRLDKYNNQIASGKKFDRPSDNPIGVATSMKLTNEISDSQQYIDNMGHAEQWLNNTETLLVDKADILQRTRELAIYTANGSLTPDDRRKVGEEVTELRKELVSTANSKMGGRYLFAGQMTKIETGGDKPFTEGADGEIEFNGDNKDLRREVGPGINMVINVDGEEAFKDTIDTLKAIEEILFEEDSTGTGIGQVGDVDLADLDEAIGEIDILLDGNLQRRAQIGAKLNRIELSKNRLGDKKLNSREMLSKNEDVDIAETLTELKMQESVYRASLSVGARIIQPTLVDFIR